PVVLPEAEPSEAAAGVKDGTGGVAAQETLAYRHRAPAHVVAAAVGLLRQEGVVESRRKVGTRPKVEGRSWDAPDGVPQTRHIERIMRARLAKGVYALQERVPRVTTLAAEFGVSASVVSSALQPLKRDGLLTYVPFRGLVMTTRRPSS
ncbi:GntR family transcriptional regulator, partial [Streptomyces sp. NPDC005568]|uniref:GntR family transcriptional regulator n=1 Tax=Streptomyces sp. NPDC005568 TaxID=3156887 RepID=UPI0033A1CED0